MTLDQCSRLHERLALNLHEYSIDAHQASVKSSYDEYYILAHPKRSGARRSTSGRISPTTRISRDLQVGLAASNHTAEVIVRITKQTTAVTQDFKRAQLLYASDADYGQHFLRALQLVHLPALDNEDALIAGLMQSPSPDFVQGLTFLNSTYKTSRSIPITQYDLLDFAVGACACLEILHHRHGLMHGELRNDAFHFDQKTRTVRLLNLGSGAVNLVQQMSAPGWEDILAKSGNLLQCFAPEQTGRIAAEPDMRTDIYALGHGFWCLAAGKMPFTCREPMEFLQVILSQNLPHLSEFRPDLPSAISQIIAKMTQKAMQDRYYSVSSVKCDLLDIKRMLKDNDEGIFTFVAGQGDVSPHFSIPTVLIGRDREHNAVLSLLDDALNTPRTPMYHRTTSYDRANHDEDHREASDYIDAKQIGYVETAFSYINKDRRRSLAGIRSTVQSECFGAFVQLVGKNGHGKTFFLHSLQQSIKNSCLYASAQFQLSKQPFDPILTIMSTLLKQIFSAVDVNTSLHQSIRRLVEQNWYIVCTHLQLPSWLISSEQPPLVGEAEQRAKGWLDLSIASQRCDFLSILKQVLTTITQYRVVFLLLDDAHLTNIESRDFFIGMSDILVLVMSFRSEKLPRIERLPTIQLVMDAFKEEETRLYVKETIKTNDIASFSSLVQDRTAGVPLHIRQFLERCHASNLITFSWQKRGWEYQMEQIAQSGPITDDEESTEIAVFQRYNRMSIDVQAFLSWTALLNTSFHVSTLRAINETVKVSLSLRLPPVIDDCLASLRVAASKFILRPDHNKHFRFTDDSYRSAACLLNTPYDKAEMHYVIASAMLGSDQHQGTAAHVVEAVKVIRRYAASKAPYLQSLLGAATSLQTSGDFVSSASLCDAALDLMAGEPWSELYSDLHSLAAQVYHLVGRTNLALQILDEIDKHVEDVPSKVPLAVNRSRIHAGIGDGMLAHSTMQAIASKFNIPLPGSLQECELRLRQYASGGLQTTSLPPGATTVLSEMILTSLWHEELIPYQHAIALISTSQGDANIVLGWIYVSAVALYQLKDHALCLRLRAMAVEAMSRCPRDIWNRGLALRAMLIGHLELGSREQIDGLMQTLESFSVIDDRGFALLTIATVIVLRVCIADNLEGLLQFIDHATEKLPGYEDDNQNGIMLVAARQVVRTLRGTTRIDAAATVMCDADHDTIQFILKMQQPCHETLRMVYRGCITTMMSFYGYHKEAVELGCSLIPWIEDVRCSLFFNAIFYHLGLAIAAVLRAEDRPDLLEHIPKIRSRLDLLAQSGVPQCQAWLLVLEAEILNDSTSLRLFNLAIETIEGKGSPIEEAICLERYIKCLIRMGATSAAISLIPRCSDTFEKAGASAKALQVLHISKSYPDGIRPTPLVVSTTFNPADAIAPVWEQVPQKQLQRTSSKQAFPLDMIDLHSIISSTQAMSSELDIDRLLRNLTKIIAESTAAETCSIVIRTEDGVGWVVTQSNHEEVPVKLEHWSNTIARQVSVYVLRFRQAILIDNTREHDVFSYSEALSVLCVPMLHSDNLLGAVYCQAKSDIFTSRTMTLVQMLVMQIAICLSNAVLFKRLEKASAKNKAAEQKAIENLRLKQEAMRTKDLFLANISHELRTPLNGVIGMSDILQTTDLTPQQADCTRSIGLCADALLNVINDILDFSKLEAGKAQTVLTSFSLAQEIKDVMYALRATRMDSVIKTSTDIRLDPNLKVLGDLPRLRQVLMNLLSNAWKFTPTGKIVVNASIVGIEGHELSTKISIEDTGIGISTDKQQKLFSPFSQADSSTERTYGGTGLGLSICKSIVEGLMKGKIWLTSVQGQGTTVTFVVPFQSVDSPVSSPSLTLKPAAKTLSGPIKVCVAEDNPVNRKIATTFVKRLGYTVEAYEDGRQAVDAITQGDFDIVLMDVQMPVMDGYSATREIRKSQIPRIRDIVVVALTASTVQGDREKCLEIGMDAYLAKPVRLDALRAVIQTFLDGSNNQ